MRKLTVAVLAAGAAAIAGPSLAADLPYYPPVIEIPDVDHGYGGSFYLRGSAGIGVLTAHRVNHPSATPSSYLIDGYGYGYSLGAGVGFETGTGIRADVTGDILRNEGMRATINDGAGPLVDGVHTLSLRSSVLLANVYYDVGFGDGYSGAGGPMAYIGAGAGMAFNDHTVVDPNGATSTAQNNSLAAAGMVGLGYDFGNFVADVGYRALYINRIENAAAAFPYSIDNNWVHEVRGTVRYRFN